MSRRSRGAKRTDPPTAELPARPAATDSGSAVPSAPSLAALTALGGLAGAWAVFLWGELVRARSGGRPFCPLGPEEGCSALWDSPLASAVHRFTGIPVAGWGVVWGVVAFALPLVALTRLAEGRPAAALLSGTRLVAAAGVVTVFVMIAVSAAERTFCFGCAATYVLVAGYAGIGLFGWRRLGLPEPGRGLALSAGLTVATFALLLFPGTRTPRAAGESARAAVASVSPPRPSDVSGQTSLDPGLQSFVDSLSPELKQGLSDALFAYRSGPSKALPPPRALIGSPDAPIRITEFTDVLCTHCAELHDTLHAMRQRLPPASFSLETREFPLDGNCNPVIPRRGPESVRCLAAKARLCLGEGEQTFELGRALYREQKTLTPDRVLELASSFVDRSRLQACIASPAARGGLEEDATLAARYEPEGTPLVLVNGRKASSFGPFLYAIVLARGDGSHPAFAGLPAARAPGRPQ